MHLLNFILKSFSYLQVIKVRNYNNIFKNIILDINLFDKFDFNKNQPLTTAFP